MIIITGDTHRNFNKIFDFCETNGTTVEDRLQYDRWLLGHYHCNKEIDKINILFEDFIEL